MLRIESPIKIIISLLPISLLGYAGYYLWYSEHQEFLALAIWIALMPILAGMVTSVPWKVVFAFLLIGLALAVIGLKCDPNDSTTQENKPQQLQLLRLEDHPLFHLKP